jgi:hypothetical protein
VAMGVSAAIFLGLDVGVSVGYKVSLSTKKMTTRMSVNFKSNVKIKQVIYLLLGVLVTFGVLISGYYAHNYYYYLIAFFSVVFFIVINWYTSFVYDIYVTDEMIICVNLYTKKQMPSDDFHAIVPSRKWIFPLILFPFPCPPYFLFKLKDGRSYLFMDSSMQAFLSTFKVDEYVDKLNQKVKSVIV